MKWISTLIINILSKLCRGQFFKPGIINEDLVKKNQPKIFTKKQKSIEIEPDGLGVYLYESMKKHDTKVTQVDAATGEVEQYCSLLRRCVRTAIELKKRGVEKTDIICVYADNNLDSVVPFVATIFIGAKIATLDTKLCYEEFSYLLIRLKPKFLFVDKNNEVYVKKLFYMSNIKTKVVVFGEPSSSGYSRFSDFVRPKEGEMDFHPYKTKNINSVALIVFTAGTTGVPKGLYFTHKFAIYTSKNILLSIYLHYSSLFNFASILLFISITSSGGRRVICPDFRPEEMWGYVESYGITDLIMSPYEAILALEHIPENFRCSLQNIKVYGSTFSEVHAEHYRKLFPDVNVCSIYGLTELGFPFQSIDPKNKNYKDKLNSVGSVTHHFDYKIVDLDLDLLLGPDKIGELRIKAPIRAFYIDTELNHDLYDEDGFLKTGDIAYYDSDFNFYVLGRQEYIYVRNHVTILPSIVENVISAHEGVEFVSAYGIRRDNNYDTIAAVTLKKDVSLSPADILNYANEKLPKYYTVTRIVFLDKLPVTPTGTVKKFSLIEEEEANYNGTSILFFTG